MKNFLNYIFLFVLLCNASKSHSQINSDSHDYKSIDAYVVSNHTHDAAGSCINILYSSSDCEKCILFLHSVLGELNAHRDKNILVNIVTDNIAYAKKNLKNYPLRFKYYFDKDIFSNFDINNRTLLYLRDKNTFTENIEDISGFIKKAEPISEVIFRVSDSVIMEKDIESRIMPLNTFITINPKMDVALLFMKANSGKANDYNAIYLNKQLKDSLKIYSLKERNPNPERLKLLPFKDFTSVAKNNSVNFYKILTITSNKNTVYCTFMISRLYKDNNPGDNFTLVTNSYIAQKEIKKESDLMDVMKLDTYDCFYFADMFQFEGATYPMSVWINSTPEIIGENTITTNLNKVIPNEGNLEFAGKATIILDPKTQTAKMISLDKNVENIRYRKNSFKVGGYLYSIKKVMTDEANNVGDITISREPATDQKAAY